MHRKRVPANTDMGSVKDSLNEPPTTGHLADEAFPEHPQWAEGGRRLAALREIYQACIPTRLSEDQITRNVDGGGIVVGRESE
jgi:hypothetical protein